MTGERDYAPTREEALARRIEEDGWEHQHYDLTPGDAERRARQAVTGIVDSDKRVVAMRGSRSGVFIGKIVRSGAIASADVAAGKVAEQHGPRIPGQGGNVPARAR